MKIKPTSLDLNERTNRVRAASHAGERLGLITSIDGKQLITLLLSTADKQIRCFETPLAESRYNSMTATVPQAHWFERIVWDMFGLCPDNHPRLKRTHLHEPYAGMAPPLAVDSDVVDNRDFHFLRVDGEGLYEIPVGPIHAGIIEPGHFRFSCFGEIIVNLEIHLGYVHRGVERRLTEVPWQNTRFLAEAAASDMAAANALANATALESLLEIEPPRRAAELRTIALEVERVCMHLADLGGLAGDIGFLSVSSALSRLRGLALRMADLVSGNRFLRSYICPGGVARDLTVSAMHELLEIKKQLSGECKKVLQFYFDNHVAIDRMERVGVVSHSLAEEFGLVGVAARASGINYDCRSIWSHALYPELNYVSTVETDGDVLARAKVRVGEIFSSLELIESLAANLSSGPCSVEVPLDLPANDCAVAIVESHRGELIHLIFTGETGKIRRYCIKDPSANNWTGLAIAVRNNLVADFPLCNKSFSLSYSGHDL
jgi:Ni,Fe-hydrogenase III large subunit